MKSLAKLVFSKVHSKLPERWGETVSEIAFRLARRPFVYFDSSRHPPARLKKAAVTFSADFEMAWAFRYSKSSKEDFIAKGLREREQVPRILGALADYSIPITWATVGHLFLSSCQRGDNGLAHPGMPRPDHFDRHWRFTSGDWFQHDPCTNMKKDPAWYAPDLIEAILSSRCKHEIASHGFSHMGFGDYCSDEVAAAELDASLQAMRFMNCRPRTLIFPGNEGGKLSLISAKGFDIVRWFPLSWADITLPLRLKEGLWGVHGTSVETGSAGMNVDRRLNRLWKFINRAIETRMCAHFWFHPSLPRGQMTELLFPLFQRCADLREKGLIDILTMEALVDKSVQAWNQANVHHEQPLL